MTNRSGSGCCGGQNAAKGDQQEAVRHGKDGCGCRGNGQKVEAAVATAAIPEPTKAEHKCCC